MTVTAPAAPLRLPVTSLGELARLRAGLQRYLRGLDPQKVDAALLVATELASNACLYGEPPVTVIVGRGADRVEVCVVDGSPVLPELPAVEPPPTQTGGRGLLICAALTSWLHFERHGAGKRGCAQIAL